MTYRYEDLVFLVVLTMLSGWIVALAALCRFGVGV